MLRKSIAVMLLFIVVSAYADATPVVLSYWGTDSDTLALDLIQDFEMRHLDASGAPTIKVIMGQSACINKVEDPQRLLTAIAGGDPPDVVWFDRFAVAEWAARGAFLSLQPFLERDLKNKPDDSMTLRPEQFYKPAWDEAVYDGHVFAIPADIDNRALYFNLDILEKYADRLIPIGCVDPMNPTKAGPPRTWKQLKQCAEILTEKDASGKLRQVGFVPNFGNSWLYMYGWLNGGAFMSNDGRTCTLNTPPVIGALTYITEIYDAMGGAEAVTAFQSTLQGGDLDPFLSGKVVMKIDCGWFIDFIANFKRDLRFAVALPPAPEGKETFGWCGGWSWVIPKGSRHPDQAWEFIKYLASRRAYEIGADALCQAARAGGNVFIPWISSRQDITEWAMEHYFYSDPTIEEKFKAAKRVFVDTMPTARYRPVTPVGQLLWNAQVRAMDGGIYKRYDGANIERNARLSLDANAQVVQAELDRIFKPQPHPILRWWPIIVTYVALLLIGGAFLLLVPKLLVPKFLASTLLVPKFLFGNALVAEALLHRFPKTKFFEQLRSQIEIWERDRRIKTRGYFRREYYAGYLFASPWFVGFLVFGGGPILFSLFMSLCQYDVLSPPQFVGIANYKTMLTADPLFYKSLWNTCYMALGVPLGMAVGLAIALLLNYEIKGMAVYRTFFYLPAIMPAVAASILWIWIFNPHEGILNTLLGHAGVTGPAWLQNQNWSKPALILMGLWSAGGGMIIWLAGLKGIPRHLYEAAEIDGAGPFVKFRTITLPMLSPYILLNLIVGLIGTFQIFSQAYIMTQGGPVDSTLFFAYHLFNNAFRYMRMGYASALAWVLFAIVLVLTLIQLRLSKHWVHYESGD